MRQPMPVDMGGENGATPMAFIQDQFARQPGGAAPMQGFNPFVPQAAQGPQMAGGGGSAPVATQAAPIAGEAAQAPTSRMQQLAAVVSNRFTPPEVRQLAIQQYQQEQAQALAVQERARAQAQNEAAARAAGIDPALLGNPVIAAAAAKSRFDRANGQPKRSLQPVFATDAQGNTVMLQPGEDGTAVQTKMPEGVRIATGVDKIDAGTKFILIDKRTGQVVGEQPKDIAGAKREEVLGADQGGQIKDAPGAIRTAEQTLATIKGIQEHPGRDAWGALGATAALPIIGNGIPGTAGRDFVTRVDQLRGKAFLEAFESLKGGGAITGIEGETATKAIARLERTQTPAGFNQALSELEAIVKNGLERARRNQRPQGGQPSGQTNAPAQTGKVLRYNPATGALE
jgi:hypothetical protein